MRKARFLAPCRGDLIAIFDYITEGSGSVAVARTFVTKLRMRCHELASYDTIVGRLRPDLGPDVRSIPHGAYIIFFRYDGERFEVVRIVEGHRDMGSLFDASSP